MTTRVVSRQQERYITALPLPVIDWIIAGPIRVPAQEIWDRDEDGAER